MRRPRGDGEAGCCGMGWKVLRGRGRGLSGRSTARGRHDRAHRHGGGMSGGLTRSCGLGIGLGHRSDHMGAGCRRRAATSAPDCGAGLPGRFAGVGQALAGRGERGTAHSQSAARWCAAHRELHAARGGACGTRPRAVGRVSSGGRQGDPGLPPARPLSCLFESARRPHMRRVDIAAPRIFCAATCGCGLARAVRPQARGPQAACARMCAAGRTPALTSRRRWRPGGRRPGAASASARGRPAARL